MTDEQLNKRFDEVITTLVGAIENLQKDNDAKAQRNKQEILDKLDERIAAAEVRLLKQLASKEELHELDVRVRALEA